MLITTIQGLVLSPDKAYTCTCSLGQLYYYMLTSCLTQLDIASGNDLSKPDHHYLREVVVRSVWESAMPRVKAVADDC